MYSAQNNKDMVIGVILNGGYSKRMGHNKNLLDLDDRSFLDNAFQIMNDSQVEQTYLLGLVMPGYPSLFDSDMRNGPLVDVCHALEYLSDLQAKQVVFIPVDMPFLNPNIINQLANNKGGDIVHFKEHIFPFCVNNPHKVIQVAKKILSDDTLKNSFQQLFEQSDCITLVNSQREEESFVNINTPEEFAKLTKQPRKPNEDHSKTK